jgi:hypothetical protein
VLASVVPLFTLVRRAVVPAAVRRTGVRGAGVCRAGVRSAAVRRAGVRHVPFVLLPFVVCCSSCCRLHSMEVGIYHGILFADYAWENPYA